MLFYYLALFGVGMVAVFASQKYSRSTKTYYDVWIYALITGIMGCAVFAVSSGFKLSFDLRILCYSAFYAVAAIISYFTTIPLYRYMRIGEANVCKSSISLVVTSLSGYVLFSEKVTVVSVIRIALMLAATFVVYYDGKDGNADKNSSDNGKLVGIILCIIAAFGSVIATVTSKTFAADERVSDTNSFFFFTNAIIIAVSAVIVILLRLKNKEKTDSERLKLWQYGMIFLTTVTSNISSVLGVLILETGDVSLYAPLSGALNLIAAQTVSVLYKEKPKLLPLIIAICAVFIGIFE